MKHIAELLVEYAIAQGATPEIMCNSIWTSEVDKHWTIKCNGTMEEMENIPALSWYIMFNGWPAGSLSLLGDGVLCAGEAGNEENLRAAIESKMEIKEREKV